MFAIVFNLVQREGTSGVDPQGVVDAEVFLILGHHQGELVSASLLQHHLAQVVWTVDAHTIDEWSWVN